MGKLGKCPKCPEGTRPVLLIGGFCHGHFSGAVTGSGEREKPESTLKKEGKKEAADTMAKWFRDREKEMPAKCENCKNPISIPKALPTKTAIAHILPKRSVKSVRTHPLNRWFGCWQCHTDYDQLPADKVAKMPVIKIARKRLETFLHLIPDTEKKYIPDYLL